MKYHINPDSGKVSPCRAKVKCRFGGSSGNENHFASKDLADKASEKNMDKKFNMGGLKKAGKTDFEINRDRIKAGLAKAGIVEKLPEVRNEKEIIEKWFNGDQKKYDLIARISNPGELKSNARNAVSGMIKHGATVGFAQDVEHLNVIKKAVDTPEDTQLSDVELLDEDFKALNLDDIRSGRLKAF